MTRQLSPGYILTARTLQQSRIWFKEPLHLKCFFWLVLNANHADVERNGYQYKRGELVTTYTEIIKAMVFYHNKKPIFPTLKQVRNILAWLTSEGMIEVYPIRKLRQGLERTRAHTTAHTGAYVGIKIVVVNYDTYQTPENYKGTHRDRATFELGHNNKNEQEKDYNAQPIAQFETFYSAYPIHRDRKKALKAWQRLNPSDALMETIHDAIKNQKATKERQKARGEFVPQWPYAATWINGERWKDEIDEPQETGNGWL